MFYSAILWYTAFLQRPRGMETCIVNLQRKLRMRLLDQLLWFMEQSFVNSNILPKKRKITGLRAAPEINEGPLHFQNHSRQKKKLRFTETFHAVFWEGFAKELTAEPQWAKCSKRWSLSGQVPPLVRTAKAKLNLLSAPLKLVSQDLELSLPSITSAGTKGRLPKGMRIRAICIHTQTIKAQQSHSDSPFHYITTVIQMECKMPRTSNYSFLQKREKMSKVKMLITIFQRGNSIRSMTHLRKHFPGCFRAQH